MKMRLERPAGRDKRKIKNLFSAEYGQQRRRPPPAAETGRSCWGSGQQDASAAQGTMRMLGAATRKKRRPFQSFRLIYSSQMAVAPQGTTPPVADTGRPISSQLVLPPKRKMIGSVFAGLNITSTLKASGAENEYVGRIQGYYAKTILLEQQLGKRQQILNAIPEVAGEISNIVVMMVGGILVINGNMTAGMLVAYTSLLSSFTEPVNQLVGFIQKIQTLKADMSRVEDIMKYEEDEKFSKQEVVTMTTKLTGEIELKNISFGYSILEKPLVEDFNFYLPCGSSIAFVGASGCGKSTVSKIVSGLYMPWSGEVLMDNINSRQIPKEIMSSSVSTVSQSITLFSGTIRDNLTMWNRNVLDEDIVKAAKDACIHEVITSKPGAYDFVLSEGGTNLSGGQRQRLEIARALVTNPSILIMDEATSALDPIVEKEIIDNIKRRGCTCLIVAHRLSAIRDCDEIIVMERGKIVQRGTHTELASKEGHYQRLIQNI